MGGEQSIQGGLGSAAVTNYGSPVVPTSLALPLLPVKAGWFYHLLYELQKINDLGEETNLEESSKREDHLQKKLFKQSVIGAVAEASSDSIEKVKALISLSFACISLTEFDEAQDSYEDLNKILTMVNDELLDADLFERLARLSQDLGEHMKALNFEQQYLELKIKEGASMSKEEMEKLIRTGSKIVGQMRQQLLTARDAMEVARLENDIPEQYERIKPTLDGYLKVWKQS
jgi:tetratricopeptide (TPR) repeat protein